MLSQGLKLITYFAVFFILAGANFNEKRTKLPIVPKFDVECVASHYVWAGMLPDAKNKYSVEVKKEKNSSPLRNRIKLKNKKLMVDNEEFTVMKNTPEEIVAMYVDGRNIITLVLNSKLGSLLYNKVFTNPMFKQNSMSFVGKCKNI